MSDGRFALMGLFIHGRMDEFYTVVPTAAKLHEMFDEIDVLVNE
jgi:hypothetical protein